MARHLGNTPNIMGVIQEFAGEFKSFAVKGNVLDLAVGVILGAAFSKVVTSVVEDLLMPPLGMVLGKVDFSSLFLSLDGRHYPSLAAAKAAGAPTFNYGQFLGTLVSFMLTAASVFLLVKAINRNKRPAAPTKACPFCRSSINHLATRCPQCTSVLSADSPLESGSEVTGLATDQRG